MIKFTFFRSRTDSLAVEARDWHAERQEPLQMSPRQSTATPQSLRRDSIAQHEVISPAYTDYQTPRERVDSVSSQRGQVGKSCQFLFCFLRTRRIILLWFVVSF